MSIPNVRGVPVWEFLGSLQKGTKEVLTTKSRIKVAGEERDKAALEETLGKLTSAYAAAEDARKEAARKLAARDLLEAEAVTFARDMVNALQVEFGKDDVTLEKFGVRPPKPVRQRSAQEKAAAVQKGLATRDARKPRAGRNEVVASVAPEAMGLNGLVQGKEGSGGTH